MKLTDEQILNEVALTTDMLEEIFEASAPRVDEGHMIGPYRLVEQVGRGSCGRVYRAEDTTLGRTVAVKLLADYASDLTEARKAVSVKHPNIVHVLSADTTWIDGREVAYVVYEFVDGPTLETYLQGKSRRRRWEVCRQAAAGLRAVHEAGVSHGDVRTCNIIVEGGQPRITDFGSGQSGLEIFDGVAPSGRFADDVKRLAAIAGIRPGQTMADLERTLGRKLRLPKVGAAIGLAAALALAAMATGVLFLQNDQKLEQSLADQQAIERDLETSQAEVESLEESIDEIEARARAQQDELERTEEERAQLEGTLKEYGARTERGIEFLEALRALRARQLGIENDPDRQRSRGSD